VRGHEPQVAVCMRERVDQAARVLAAREANYQARAGRKHVDQPRG
jgi:hypothetical protein